MEDTLKQGVEPNQQENRSSKIHRDVPQKDSAENEAELSKPSTIPKNCGMVVLFQAMLFFFARRVESFISLPYPVS